MCLEKLSVIMCVYKEKESDLCLAIESILNQTYRNFEFIIVLDNPLNYPLKAIIQNYAENDKRIVYIENKSNIGLANSLNIGIQRAKNDIIVRMDADDISDIKRFEKELIFLKNNPNYKVVSVNKIVIDEYNNIQYYGGTLPNSFAETKKAIFYGSMILHPGTMYYKEFIKKIGGYRNLMPAEDYDLWLRVIDAGGQIGFLDEYLLQYRVRKNSISTSNPMIQWYTEKYVKALHEERIITGKDSYSEKNFNDYLKKNKCDDYKKIEKFNRGYRYYIKSRELLKLNKIFNGIKNLIFAIIYCPFVIEGILTNIKYRSIIKKAR